jgi:hypothetical protein
MVALHDPWGRTAWPAGLPVHERAALRPPPPPAEPSVRPTSGSSGAQVPGLSDRQPGTETRRSVGATSPPPRRWNPAIDRQPTGPSGPAMAKPDEFQAVEIEMAAAARRAWSELPLPDMITAVEAGMLAATAEEARRGTQVVLLDPGPLAAVGSGCGTEPGSAVGAGLSMAAAVGQAAAAVQRQGLPPSAVTPVDWSEFGTVIPVLGCSPGSGASVVATLLADVLQLAGQTVLMVDTADPTRSGLAVAARSDGPKLRGPHPLVGLRLSWRAKAVLARIDSSLPISPGMVPPPRFWLPPGDQRPQVTVVDLAHDAWRLAASPVSGAGAWLRGGQPAPCAVLVVQPSRPSLLHAEQVLARLETWIGAGAAIAPARLVVAGAKRWPPGVAGTSGRRVAALLPEAVFVPHDAELAASGITAAITPPKLRQAITPLLRDLGLLPDPAQNTRRRGIGRRKGLSR